MDDLPPDFTERLAYMRLYRSHKNGETFWHSSCFGAEITTLLQRSHAEAVDGGYRLTRHGVTHWEAYVRAWSGDPPQGVTRTTQALLNLKDGAWHTEDDAAAFMTPTTWRAFIRPRLEKQGLIERHKRTRMVRLTDMGQQVLQGALYA